MKKRGETAMEKKGGRVLSQVEEFYSGAGEGNRNSPKMQGVVTRKQINRTRRRLVVATVIFGRKKKTENEKCRIKT